MSGMGTGSQNHDPSGSAGPYFAGLHEAHVRYKQKMSHAHAPGLGSYTCFWPAHDGWSSELDIMESPGDWKDRFEIAVHSNPEYDIGKGDHRATATRWGIDLAQWRTVDARRTYKVVNGDVLGSFRVWIDGTPIVDSYHELFTDNSWIDEPMGLGFAGYFSTPSGHEQGVKDWYGVTNGDTPTSGFYTMFKDFELWEPGSGVPPGGGGGGGGTPGPVTLTPNDPGTRPAGVWNTTVSAPGRSKVFWVVSNGAPNWNWTSGGQDVTLDQNGQAPLAANLTTTGQYVQIYDFNGGTKLKDSGQVTIA